MITIHENGQNPVAQGNTTLDSDKTLECKGKKGIDICCPECSNPFVLSLQKFGAFNDSVICHTCKKELCFIVEKWSGILPDDIKTYMDII